MTDQQIKLIAFCNEKIALCKQALAANEPRVKELEEEIHAHRDGLDLHEKLIDKNQKHFAELTELASPFRIETIKHNIELLQLEYQQKKQLHQNLVEKLERLKREEVQYFYLQIPRYEELIQFIKEA